jgi:hypothetical protein
VIPAVEVTCGESRSIRNVTERWWREELFEIGDIRTWRIGPLSLVIQRTAREWKLAYRWNASELSEPEWQVDAGGEFPEDGWEFRRFVFSATGEGLELAPALADRPVVTSPRVPLFVSPGERVTLFVGSPLWLVVRGEGQSLLEIPVHRPSDTWFGPSTREGELCYAARTRAALEIVNLPVLSRRAATPVHIKNRADTALQLERLKLPVPFCSLFAADDGTVWTEAVTMTREESSEMAEVRLRSGPPSEAGEAALLTAPRNQVDTNAVMQVFSTFGTLLGVMGDER